MFRAENPDYAAGIEAGVKPRPSRWLDMELHGVWGKGVPGALQVGGRRGAGAADRPSGVWARAGGLWLWNPAARLVVWREAFRKPE